MSRKRSARRNGVEAAAALSEAFHGRPAHRITEYTEEIHEHEILGELGRLVEIKLRAPSPVKAIKFDDSVVKLGYSEPPWAQKAAGVETPREEGSQQLYVVGGDQSVDLANWPDADPTKAKVILGLVKDVTYSTAKYHLGAEDKIPGPYEHLLAEEGGDPPLLIYDTMNGLIEFVGGTYHIDVDMGGKYSAGIRD